jgi:hypothetical protein
VEFLQSTLAWSLYDSSSNVSLSKLLYNEIIHLSLLTTDNCKNESDDKTRRVPLPVIDEDIKIVDFEIIQQFARAIALYLHRAIYQIYD